MKTLREFEQKTGRTPQALQDQPQILFRCKLYYQAFGDLSRCRPVGMAGEMPITIGDVKAYLDLIDEHGTENRLHFLHMMQQLDEIYLQHRHKQSESKGK